MSNAFNPNEHPHRRHNPLTNEWILVPPDKAIAFVRERQDRILHMQVFDNMALFLIDMQNETSQLNGQ